MCMRDEVRLVHKEEETQGEGDIDQLVKRTRTSIGLVSIQSRLACNREGGEERETRQRDRRGSREAKEERERERERERESSL